MTSLNVGPGGGTLPTHDDLARVYFPPGALKKPTVVMIQVILLGPFLHNRHVQTSVDNKTIYFIIVILKQSRFGLLIP